MKKLCIVEIVVALTMTWNAGVITLAQDQSKKIEKAVKDLQSDDAFVRDRAATDLWRLAPDIKPAIPALVSALSDKYPDVRWNAAKALGIVGPEAREAVPALVRILQKDESRIQTMAGWALYRTGPGAKEAVPALLAALRENKFPLVRREAARALGAIGPDAREALPALTAALEDENGFVRVAAAAALWQVGQDARGIPLIITALKDQPVVSARIAADTLAELGPGAKPAVPALVETLKDPASCARVAAARALWLIDRNTDGVPALIAALRDPDFPEVRTDAAAALRLMQGESKAPLPGVAEALKEFETAKPPAPPGPQPLVFETEDWTGPADAIVKDKDAKDKWKFASRDERFTRNTVLVSPGVPKDRATPEEGAPVLHTHITGIPKGTYAVMVAHSRPLAVSLDAGKTWKKFDTEGGLGIFDVKDGAFDLWVDDRYACPESIGGSYYDTVTFTPATRQTRTPVQGWAKERVREPLDRGLTAMRLPEGGVYLSWRLLDDDPSGVAFDVYRCEGDGQPSRLNEKPIARTTDFTDTTAAADKKYEYSITIAGQPKDRVASPPALAPDAPLPYFPIKLQGNYTAQRVGAGDLDGDGRMDYVIKQPAYGIDPYYTYWHRSCEPYKIEAYRADGKFLWRHDLGWGIEQGIWYSPYVVFDLDGDGRAEVACKAAEGDPRDADGKVTSGPEYVAILDGLTGKVRCRAEWPGGENSYGLASRNQLGVAYLDGKTPCLIVERGTYGVQKVDAYQLRGDHLEKLWSWDNRNEDRRYWGQGAHILHAADVDGDGRDEVLLGSSALDDNGTALWSTGLGHPDNFYVGEIDPDHPGFEIFYNIEVAHKENGICLVDARTGQFLWGKKEPTYHVDSGLTSDIDPAHPGCESRASEAPKSLHFQGRPPQWLFSAKGEVLAENEKVPPSQAAYWDGDPQRELLAGSRIRKYPSGIYPLTISGSVLAVADVAGDWREEIITCVPGELRIYQTTIPACDRRVCLLQDPLYRLEVAVSPSGYYAVPMTSTCFSTTTPTLGIVGPEGGLAPDAPSACEVLVVAPSAKPLSGEITLTVGSNATVEPTKFSVQAEPGKVARHSFMLRLTQPPPPLAGRAFVTVTATLDSPSGGLETRAPLGVAERPFSGVPLVEAEDFVEQSGGEVHIRTDKPGASGKAFSHWDNKGHKISWKIAVPNAGRYHLAFRYACGAESERGLLVDGKPLPGVEKLAFPPSGGLGGASGEWSTFVARLPDGKPAAVELSAGPHTITMENLNAKPLNLDQIALVPAP